MSKNNKNSFFKKRKSSRRLVKPAQNKNFLNKIIIIIIGILILVFFLDDHGLYSLYEVNKTKKNLKEEINLLRKKQIELKSDKNKLENDIEYIEDLAREKFRMAKPGEKVIKVIRDSNYRSEP